MADILNNLFGGAKPAASPIPSADSDFADFAGAPDPVPEDYSFNPAAGSAPVATARPYTKWYRVDERHSLSDFKTEGVILICMAVVLVVHLVGARLNRNKAKKWARAHIAPLAREFSLVGFNGVPGSAADKNGSELVEALADANMQRADAILKEKSLFEFATYATGRANVAFVDVKLTLVKRFNPFSAIVESAMGFFIESAGQPEDILEAILYPFDGKEAQTVPALPGASELRAKDSKSTFDGFVWALVNKDRMKTVRDERYDVSLTFTKDNAKLPVWLTVMTESAEITDVLLTPELIKAAESAGELLDHLIITDQPVEKPATINETAPRKRVYLKYRLPSNNDYAPLVPLFEYFLGVSDLLVQAGHFRPEVLKKVKAVREEAIRQIQKVDENEKAEERAIEREKTRKAKRDQELNALDAKAQKKYLEKEREKQLRKSTKKQSTRA